MGDRTTRPPGEAAEFQDKFEEFVKALHPDYERNRLVLGIRHECLRELLPGVFASHNVLCLKGTYYHGFCITLHRELADPYLISPFMIGGRFNHNNRAKLAYFRDVEPARKWPFGKLNFSDSHSYRRGWEEIAEKCTRVAEEKMLPHYFAEVQRYKKPLSHLLDQLLRFGEVAIEIDRGRGLPPCSLYPHDYDMQRFAKGYVAAGKERDEFVLNIIRDKPELFNRLREMRSLQDLVTTLRG